MIDVPVDEAGSDYSDTDPVTPERYGNAKPVTPEPYGITTPKPYAPPKKIKCTPTKWTSWSQSSVSCGQTTVSRNRACTKQGQICEETK